MDSGGLDRFLVLRTLSVGRTIKIYISPVSPKFYFHLTSIDALMRQERFRFPTRRLYYPIYVLHPICARQSHGFISSHIKPECFCD